MPQDHWYVGFVIGMTHHNPPRYEVVDSIGVLARGNGFRRAEQITKEEGKFLVDCAEAIERSDVSLWEHLSRFRNA
jgi:hypothetical protein